MPEALFYGYGVLLLFEPLEQSASIGDVRNGRAMFETYAVSILFYHWMANKKSNLFLDYSFRCLKFPRLISVSLSRSRLQFFKGRR